MKKKAHSESEMVKAVKTLESGVSADTVAREFGISKGTLYNWNSKYSGMNVSQIQRLKELEEENRKLKQMYADLALDNRILKDVIEKNSRARGQEAHNRRNSR
ncbi:MAG: transposase [Bacteroidales bacterium]|nr:transposase [Bacteroidales bacterium]